MVQYFSPFAVWYAWAFLHEPTARRWALLVFLVAMQILAGLHLGWLYWLGVLAVALLLAYEHSLVRPGDLRRLNAAFFTVNGVMSMVFFAFVLAEAAT